jgi:hypothetical protein
LKLNRFAAAPSIDSLVSRARVHRWSGTQNCENNPMQSRNGASHYPKTQDLVVRIGASGREKNAAHLAWPPTSSHPALGRVLINRRSFPLYPDTHHLCATPAIDARAKSGRRTPSYKLEGDAALQTASPSRRNIIYFDRLP